MKPLLLSWWLLCGADATTTHYGLNMGAQEAALPSQNPYVIDSMVMAQAAAGDYAVRRLRKTHPKVAIGAAVGLIAIRGYVVQHNLREIARHR